MFTTEQIKELIKKNDVHKFYNNRAWRNLSHAVMSQQHNECQECRQKGRYSKAVVVHHVNHLRKRPDLAYSTTFTDSNGKEQRQLIALCHDCHERIHGRGAYKESKKFCNVEKW